MRLETAWSGGRNQAIADGRRRRSLTRAMTPRSNAIAAPPYLASISGACVSPGACETEPTAASAPGPDAVIVMTSVSANGPDVVAEFVVDVLNNELGALSDDKRVSVPNIVLELDR